MTDRETVEMIARERPDFTVLTLPSGGLAVLASTTSR